MSWKDHPLHCDCIECVASSPVYAGKRGAARGLIERLARGGVSFEASEAGDKVRLYPKGAVVGEELDELRRLKPDVMTLLSEDDAHKRRGEGRVRDELEVFRAVREHSSLEKNRAAS